MSGTPRSPGGALTHRTRVEVATVWSSPSAPRPVDAPAVADIPDIAAWVAALSDADHLDLQGRTLTQLLRHEPVLVHEVSNGWARLSAPWQPCPDDLRGYPGWVRAAHMESLPEEHAGVLVPMPSAVERLDRLRILRAARRYVGLRYLWGGTSPSGFDCSGLVHFAYRSAGLVVPRDAHAQYLGAEQVELGAEEPGDLYFFAPPGQSMTHVGFVAGPGRVLHAPGGARLEEVELPSGLRDILVAAGRFTAGSVLGVPALGSAGVVRPNLLGHHR